MTMYRVGPAGIPASLKTNMDAVLNKKFGTSTTYAPATWPDNVNLLGPLPEKTVSGSVASITDGADGVPIKNWLVTLPASLTGYSAINGTKNTGTGTPETQYTVSLGRTIHGGSVDVVNGTGTDTHAKMTFTGAADETWYWSESSGNYRVYAPLANAKTGTNTFISNLITPAPLPSGYPAIGTGWINNNGRIVIGVDSSITSVSDWKTYLSSNNMEIAYELADEYKTALMFTPITPTPETALGVNNFWADEGDSDVTYRADINMLIASLSGNRGLMMTRPQLEEITEENKEEESPEVTEK